MGYAVYQDFNVPPWIERWAGYGVPAECDWPGCAVEIDRGLDYKCEEHGHYADPEDDPDETWIEVEGCGLFFCYKHQRDEFFTQHAGIEPKEDTLEWVRHVMTDETWQRWRDENPISSARMQARLEAGK